MSQTVETERTAVVRGHAVEIAGVSHRYGSNIALDAVDLSIRAGEIAALLGPSGCGKTTLLRIIAGFVRQSAGSVMVGSQRIDGLPANRRNVGIVFQNYALFPHMSVEHNVSYGLRVRGVDGREVKRRVSELLEIVHLAGFGARFPSQLSGGQQQRVALARALAVEPSVLLLDEPFSALDKSLRLDMQIELKRLQRQFGLTAILVTHDQDEAMSVADRIAVMNRGRVEQYDTPVAVYDRPSTLFVSGFIGTTNLLSGEVLSSDSARMSVRLDAGGTVEVPVRDLRFRTGERVTVSIRPEHLMLSDAPMPERWRVRRRMVVPLGASAVHDLETGDGSTIKLVEPRTERTFEAGAEAWCGLRPDGRAAVFAANPSR